MDQQGGVREEAATLLLRLSSQQQQKPPEHELPQPGLSAVTARTAPPTVVQLDDEDDEKEAAEKRKLSINFLLNTPATPVVGGKSRATSAPPSPTAPASPLSSSLSSSSTTWRPPSPPLPVLQPLPPPLLPAFPTTFSPQPPPLPLGGALSSSATTTTPTTFTSSSSSSSSSSATAPVFPHAVVEAGGLGLPTGLLHAGLPRPAPVDDEEVLRRRREKHVQRQRELLLHLLQEKRLMGTNGKVSNSDDDVDGHLNYIAGNPVEKRQRKPSLGKTATRRRGPTWMDLDDGLDGMSDGLVQAEDGVARLTGEWHPRGGRGPTYVDLEQSPNDPSWFHTRGDWQASRSHRATPPASGGIHPRYAPVEPRNNVQNTGVSSRRPHHQAQQGLSVVGQGGSLNELDEDDEGTSPPELVRLYGGSNQHQHPYLDDLARRRRRQSARTSPPTSASDRVASLAANNIGSRHHHHVAKPPSPPPLPPPRTRRIYEELDDEGDVDGEWPDVGDTAQFRSSMPPVPAHVRRSSAGSLLPSSSSSSAFASDGYASTAGDGANGGNDGINSRHGSLTAGTSGLGGSNGDVGSGLEDGARKRASPEQMQMLQQILSTLEQCPQKLQEIERSAVVPTRRRKRRTEALSNGSTSSAGASTTSSSTDPSPTSPAATTEPTTSSGQVAASDLTTAPREGEGEGGSDESGSSSGSSRKRRRRDREVLIFHHMKVQEDGKMMVSQRS